MFPRVHFILGIIFAATLLYLFPQIGLFGAILIFLSSFLIDVDHYIFYVIIEKDLSLSNAYNWHLMNRKKMKKLSKKERRKHKNEILFFHGLEPLIILYFLSLFYLPFMFILIGFTFHLVLDIFDEIRTNRRVDKISLIYDLIKYKTLKKV